MLGKDRTEIVSGGAPPSHEDRTSVDWKVEFETLLREFNADPAGRKEKPVGARSDDIQQVVYVDPGVRIADQPDLPSVGLEVSTPHGKAQYDVSFFVGRPQEYGRIVVGEPHVNVTGQGR